MYASASLLAAASISSRSFLAFCLVFSLASTSTSSRFFYSEVSRVNNTVFFASVYSKLQTQKNRLVRHTPRFALARFIQNYGTHHAPAVEKKQRERPPATAGGGRRASTRVWAARAAAAGATSGRRLFTKKGWPSVVCLVGDVCLFLTTRTNRLSNTTTNNECG